MGDGKSFWLGVATGAATGVVLGYAIQRAYVKATEGAHMQLCLVTCHPCI